MRTLNRGTAEPINAYAQPRAPSIFILSAASIYLTSAKLTLFYLSVLLAATLTHALAATFPPRAATYHSAGAATSSYTVARHLRASVRPSKPFFSIGPYSSLSIVSKIVFSVRFCAQKMLVATLLRNNKKRALILIKFALIEYANRERKKGFTPLSLFFLFRLVLSSREEHTPAARIYNVFLFYITPLSHNRGTVAAHTIIFVSAATPPRKSPLLLLYSSYNPNSFTLR